MDKIRLQGIRKIYNAGTESSVTALRRIDLTVPRGQMLAIRGVSGSGKSTLLHIIGCLDAPGKGEYFLDGQKVAFDNSKTMARIRNKQIGFVLQQFGLLLERKVIDNVTIPLLFSKEKLSDKRIRQRALNVMRKLDIFHKADKLCSQLSGGEKQRVAIARALVNDPDIILADEPTGAVDTKTRDVIMGIFRDLANEGKTVIIVTHDPVVAQACDRILTIEDGRFIVD
ncbi:MAG: ABC transporter ATP-binding protein [Christensenellales bacterium]